MKKILNLIKNAPLKSKFLVGVLTLGLAVPGIILAWGPDRPTYTMEKPADHVTFNSITNAKGKYFYGDERNFVLIKEEGSNQWVNEVELKPGKTYEVFNYFHNNASTTLNDAAHNYAGIAKNVTMRVNAPASVKSGERAQFLATVSADNAQPKSVWDQAWGQNKTGADLALRAVPNSATIYTAGKINGAKLPNTIYSTGTQLGYDSLNGEVPGCLPYAGFVSYKVAVDQPNFEISKKVSKTGKNQWTENISVAPGEKVDYLIEYKNTGTTQQDNVILKDQLPAGMVYVNGSASIAKPSNNFTPAAVGDGIGGTGINIGHFTAGSNAFLKFSATAPTKDKIAECGKDIKLTNTASASTQNGAKSDTADITVRKDCEPTPKKPGVSIEKTVNGKEKISIEAGKDFTYELVVKNTGEVDLKNVAVTDKAPANVQFIGTDKGTIKDNALSYTIAELKVGQSQTIKIKARATKQGITAKNTACVDAPAVPGNPDDCDDAEIETPKPGYTCEALNIKKLERTKFEFTTQYTVKNTEFKGVKYIIKDANGKVTVDKTVNNGTKLTLTNPNVGKYTVEATVITKDGNATADKCKGQFEIEKEQKPGISIEKTVNGKENITTEANKDFTYELVVKNTGNVDLKDVKVTDKAPANVKFISTDKGSIKDNSLDYTIPTLKVGQSETIKIKAQATKEDIKAKNTACVDTPTIPGGPDDCDDANIEVPKPKKPGVSIEKTVNGKEKISIEAGKDFTYELVVKNTGEVDLKNVAVTDKAPANVQFIGTDKGTIKDNALSYTIAELKVGQSQTIKIKARATKQGITAKNTACVDAPAVPGNPDDCDDAEIETPKPAYTCDTLTITKISRTKFELNTDYTVKNTEFRGVKYIVKDASGKVVVDKTVNNGTKLTVDNQNTGKYTVESTVITKDGNATSDKCKGAFEVTQEDKPGISIQKTVNGKENIKVGVNETFTYELVVRNTGNVDLKDVLVTDNAPESVKFISADKGEIKDNKFAYTIPTLKVGQSETIKIKAQATREDMKAKNTACVDTPTVPGNPDDCDDADVEVPPKPETPEIPEIPTTPETPAELPQTGMTEAVSALIGAGSITAALGYYIASRRQLP